MLTSWWLLGSADVGRGWTDDEVQAAGCGATLFDLGLGCGGGGVVVSNQDGWLRTVGGSLKVRTQARARALESREAKSSRFSPQEC